MNRSARRQSGSMLFLIVCIAAFIFIPILILVCRIGPYAIQGGRAQNAVEAAGLLAANSLSRIVINDTHFGFVSLSNQPAVGTATKATDGEALPVTGINTIVGTIRQNAIIADKLNNRSMKALVSKDHAYLQATIRSLNKRLSDSLDPKSSSDPCLDLDGNEVKIAADVRTFLSSNLPANMKVKSLNLSLGWLQDGSQSGVEVPQPREFSYVNGEDIQSGQYEAFKSYPVGNLPFSFAGLDKQSHAVSGRKFQVFDSKHICSIIKIDCIVESENEPGSQVRCAAYCQPAARSDSSAGGAMIVRYSGKPVPGLNSWNDFLASDTFHDNKVTGFYVYGGDFPYEKKSRMYEYKHQEFSTTAQQFAEHLYYWLRNGHMRPRIDAVLSMLNEPFGSGTNEVYVYEFQDNGSISRRVLDGNGFTRAVIADGQFATMADTRINKSGASAIINFKNSVRRIASNSGKHGGQPLAGYPLNGTEHWADHQNIASQFSKRNENKKSLAVDIEIGSAGASTARQDILSMREKTKSRRI